MGVVGAIRRWWGGVLMGVPDLYLLDSLLHCSVEALIEANSRSGDGVNRCSISLAMDGKGRRQHTRALPGTRW